MSEPHQGFHVWIASDDEPSVWYVRDSDLPGLVAEGETVDALRDKLLPRVRELLQLNHQRTKRFGDPSLLMHLVGEPVRPVDHQ